MSSRNRVEVPEAKEAMNKFKFEVAEELGVPLNHGYNGNLTSYQNGAFTVHDPASKIRSSRTYTFSEIREQIKNMWYFTEN